MNPAPELHQRAMELTDRSVLARLSGDLERSKELLREAYLVERQAAYQIATDLEPSRSILLRSAASLALDCGEVREAERLISLALTANPPDEILDELRDLLEQVYFQRHLSLRGISLLPTEFQLSLAGQAVGFGIADSDHFITRVKDLETLIYRTAERKRGREFRERSRRAGVLQRDLQLFVSVPRAASFAVSFRVGGSQLALPGMDFAQEVVDDVLDCIDFFSKGENEPLKEKIHDEAYLRNFIGLARHMLPDGEEIQTVGLTSIREDRQRTVVLSKPRKEVRPSAIVGLTPFSIQQEIVTVQGLMKFSDSRNERRGLIKVVDREGREHRIRVPAGMMRDIVRPMYEDEVVVLGRRRGSTIMMETIDPAP
jgi:hypothetical protein